MRAKNDQVIDDGNMLGRLPRLRKAIALVALATSAELCATPTQTPPGNITFLVGGWYSADSLVQVSSTFTNPEGCTSADGYSVVSQDAGHDWFNSMLLSAYMGNRRVILTVNGCSATGRPHIIAVQILP